MSTRARKIPNLSAATTVSNTDLFLIEVVGANTSTTKHITGTLLKQNIRKNLVPGPYANDSVANSSGGIVVGELYYTSSGDIKIRLA